MTTLVSWVSFTTSGEKPNLPRAVYVASDSRITWGNGGYWDGGRKVFTAVKEPHMFSYCGNVVFPAIILSQIVSAIDAGVLFEASDAAHVKQEAVNRAIRMALKNSFGSPESDFKIHHVMREDVWPNTKFRAWDINCEIATGRCVSREIDFPSTTGVLTSLGSGDKTAKKYLGRWENSDVKGTSRSIFSSFCDSIKSGDDPSSGGAPQLVALFTEGPPKHIGVHIDKGWFLGGLAVDVRERRSDLMWWDNIGQAIDQSTSRCSDGARRYHRPRSVDK